MARHCEFSGGCSRPGLYAIYTPERSPLSIAVCNVHRALWVESCERRTEWPCAVQGCPRSAQQDGLCEHCWTVIRAHDGLVQGEVEPALRRLAVRHVARPVVAPVPTPADIEIASKTVEQLRQLVRSVAALAGRAPEEYAADLEEAAKALSDAARTANLLAKVELVQPEGAPEQRRLF